MPLILSLKQFDGPLDLLLHLINKAKIDIKDILVSEITEQYIDSVHQADFIDMEDGTAFLVMAATLIEIKSKSLLPNTGTDNPEDDDMEGTLIRQLEEYKRYKDASAKMKYLEEAAALAYCKLPEEYPLPPPDYELTGLSPEAIARAMYDVLLRNTDSFDKDSPNIEIAESITRDAYTVKQCMVHILQKLKRVKQLRFDAMLSDTPIKEEVVALFIALLELLRLGKMSISQGKTCDTIILMQRRGKNHAKG